MTAPQIAVGETLAGKELLVTGVTGFLGKVLVVHLLLEVPQLRRIHVLIRGQKGKSALDRFTRIASTSPAFRPLRERFGDDLGAFLGARIEVHEGDVADPLFGLSDKTIKMLSPRLDAIVHVAGLTDFAADPRQALEVNVEGALHAADLAARCERAVLIHTSTCYVAGTKNGHIPEEVSPFTPRGRAFDAEAELAHLQALACHEADNDSHAAMREARDVRVGAASARAELLGFTNIYTYSKALAESLLVSRSRMNGKRRPVPLTIVRPAIIECALSLPVPGWNEGINTSGPLMWLCKSYFRHFPCSPDLPFDVVPVDVVTASMIAITAAAILGRSAPVYHVGTSTSNPLTIDRALELTNLAIRRDFLDSDKKTERHLQRFFDSVPVSYEDEHAFSPPKLKRLARSLRGFLEGLDVPALLPKPLKKPVGRPLSHGKENAELLLEGADRQLGRVQKLFDLYKPFINDNAWHFDNTKIHALDAMLDEDSRARFGWKGDTIDWRRYWLDQMYPGINKWCLPLLEGREVPEDPPVRLELLPPLPEADAVIVDLVDAVVPPEQAHLHVHEHPHPHDHVLAPAPEPETTPEPTAALAAEPTPEPTPEPEPVTVATPEGHPHP
jgi:long-chain acyl-CoA synthetase